MEGPLPFTATTDPWYGELLGEALFTFGKVGSLNTGV